MGGVHVPLFFIPKIYKNKILVNTTQKHIQLKKRNNVERDLIMMKILFIIINLADDFKKF